MAIQTSLFLPPNAFAANSSYAASLIGSNGNTSTLAIQCTAAVSQGSLSQSAPTCGPSAPTTTITIAPTTVELTTVSKGPHGLVTIAETCTMAPAASTAVCNITADTGLTAPFPVNAALYSAYVLPVNVTNVAATTTATSSSSGTTTVVGKTLFALLALCAVSAAVIV